MRLKGHACICLYTRDGRYAHGGGALLDGANTAIVARVWTCKTCEEKEREASSLSFSLQIKHPSMMEAKDLLAPSNTEVMSVRQGKRLFTYTTVRDGEEEKNSSPSFPRCMSLSQRTHPDFFPHLHRLDRRVGAQVTRSSLPQPRALCAQPSASTRSQA